MARRGEAKTFPGFPIGDLGLFLGEIFSTGLSMGRKILTGFFGVDNKLKRAYPSVSFTNFI